MGGNKKDGQAAYIRAYQMDRTNEKATQGLIETCSAAMQSHHTLQHKIEEVQGQLEALRKEQATASARTCVPFEFEWNVKSLIKPGTPSSKGTEFKSADFNLTPTGVKATLSLYPKGDATAGPNESTLFLMPEITTRVNAELYMDESVNVLDV